MAAETSKAVVSSGEITETSQDADDDSSADMVIFQCSACRKIIGDSTAWAAAKDMLKTITLYHIGDDRVFPGKKYINSTSGYDIGCTFVELFCTGCESVVGKIYKTTSKQLDDIRDYYTLNVCSIEIYVVDPVKAEKWLEKRKADTRKVELKLLSADLSVMQRSIIELRKKMKDLERSVRYNNSLDEEVTTQFEEPPRKMVKRNSVGYKNKSGSDR